MIEALYKKILISVFLLTNLYVLSNDLNLQNYIFADFIPYQESKTAVGINIYNDSDKLHSSFLLHNWFTNNLYINGSILSTKNVEDINLKYNISMGYAYNMQNKIIKNIIFNLGYNRIRFRNDISDDRNMLYALLLNMKLKNFWTSFSYSVIDTPDKIKQLSINIIKPIYNSFILTFGIKYAIYNDNDPETDNNLITSCLSLRYKI